MLIANIFSVLQMVFFGLSTVQKKEKFIYIFQALAPACIAIALIVKGGYTAAAMAIITTIANFLVLKGRLNNTVFTSMLIAMLAITFFTYRQSIDILSLVAAMEGIGVKRFCKTARNIHLGMSVNCTMYAITDMYFSLIPSAIADTAFAVSSLVSFIRLLKTETNAETNLTLSKET